MPPSLQTSKYFSIVTYMGNMNIKKLKFVFCGMFIELYSIQVFMPWWNQNEILIHRIKPVMGIMKIAVLQNFLS